MTATLECDFCKQAVRAPDTAGLADAFLAHVREAHMDFPYPDEAVRNYAEAKQRLTGSTERLDEIGAITVESVDAARLDDWLAFFDHDAFAGKPEWAACYCSEPHTVLRGTKPEDVEPRTWRQNRATMIDLLRTGRSFGYLAYVDGRPAGWVNASKRSEYALFRLGSGSEPADEEIIGVSCFIVAPPYRRHRVADALLDRVIADAPGRGVTWIEAYPAKIARPGDAPNFRGPRSMYDQRGFELVRDRTHDSVVRRRA
jgi:GNAT superfamily N-acetyltransferase